MGRILGIDYGTKRIGLAVTDPACIIATGLETVYIQDIFRYIKEYTEKEKVVLFVVGHPKTMKNEDSESYKYIKGFVKTLRKKYPEIPVEMYDERFTSVLAHKALLEGGAKKKTRQNKALIDTMSATIILTSYLENKRYLNL